MLIRKNSLVMCPAGVIWWMRVATSIIRGAGGLSVSTSRGRQIQNTQIRNTKMKINISIIRGGDDKYTNVQIRAYKLIQNATSIKKYCGGCSQRSEVTLNRPVNWAATIQNILYIYPRRWRLVHLFVHFIKDVEVNTFHRSMLFETSIKCTLYKIRCCQ